jgi:inorganic pyrophosphatase
MGADRQTDGAPTKHGICPRCLDERLEALSEAPPAGRRALGLVRSRPPGGPALRLGKKSRGIWLAGLLMWVATGCAVGGSEAPPQPAAPNLHWGYPAMPGPGLVNVVVEIPAGTNAKWQVAEDGSSVEWESMNGEPRVVAYLAYPASYGMIPGTFVPRESGGDGDPLDAILLGPALERGTVAVARPIGVLFLSDDGERDDKVLAVQTTGPLSDVADLEDLLQRYPGVGAIIETWFTHYKGPDRLRSRGMAGRAEALRIIREASGHCGEVSSGVPLH